MIGIGIISTTICISAQTESTVLKKYALNKCLANNYKRTAPTFISHDYSASYMIQIKNADYNKLNLLDKHIEKTTSDYYKMGITENLEDSKANYIFWYCMDFYDLRS